MKPSPVAGEVARSDMSVDQGSERIVVLDPARTPPASPGASARPIPLPEAPLEPLSDITESVSRDGTVTLSLGNRFARPLVARMNCAGVIVQTHDADAPSPADCDDKTGAVE